MIWNKYFRNKVVCMRAKWPNPRILHKYGKFNNKETEKLFTDFNVSGCSQWKTLCLSNTRSKRHFNKSVFEICNFVNSQLCIHEYYRWGRRKYIIQKLKETYVDKSLRLCTNCKRLLRCRDMLKMFWFDEIYYFAVWICRLCLQIFKF